MGITTEADQLFHILYDGTVVDERRFSVLGGDAEAIAARLGESFTDGQSLDEVLNTARSALTGPDRILAATELEVAVLSRRNGRRCFKRLTDEAVASSFTD